MLVLETVFQKKKRTSRKCHVRKAYGRGTGTDIQGTDIASSPLVKDAL